MTVDPAVVPGLLLLALELLALAAVGYVVARVALRQSDDRMALAQGLVIGPALWGLVASFTLHLLPGMVGTAAVWIVVLALTAGLASRTPKSLRPGSHGRRVRRCDVCALLGALACRQLLTIADAPIHLALSATIRAGTYPPDCLGILGCQSPITTVLTCCLDCSHHRSGQTWPLLASWWAPTSGQALPS